jgi:hypothetical protein
MIGLSVEAVGMSLTTGRSEFDSLLGGEVFLLATVVIPALQSTKPLIKNKSWVPPKRLKRSRNESDHLPHLVRGLKVLRDMSPVPYTSSDDNLTFTSLLHQLTIWS